MTALTKLRDLASAADLLADWRHRAACVDVDSDIFFPIGTTGPALAQTVEAKAVCAGCVSRPDCLSWAMAQPGLTGIFGGLDEVERAALRRKGGHR